MTYVEKMKYLRRIELPVLRIASENNITFENIFHLDSCLEFYA